MALRFGAHMPTAGGLHNAILSGHAIACDTVQVFTSSPRQWAAKPLTGDAIALWKSAVIDHAGVFPLVAHDSYLINLASPDPDARAKSFRAFVDELERCEALCIPTLVSHPGAHVGTGEDAGLLQIIATLDEIHAATEGVAVKVALETTAGQGTYLGAKFEHLFRILDGVKAPDRLRVCFDTCHVTDSGYDLPADPTAVLDEFDRIVGLKHLAVLHANDSEFGVGSRRDRHAHIGEGKIGDDAFARLLKDPRLPENLPVIVETPEAETHHERNVAKLKALYVGN